MVEIENVTKVFPAAPGAEKTEPTCALHKINLKIQPGEFIAFVGPSGCGKSTLLRIVAGLETASEGLVRINGQTVEGVNPNVGFVFQDPNLFPWLTIRENVAFGPRMQGKGFPPQVDELLRRVGLAQFSEALPHHLSGGMAQRAALVRALVNQPPVLLLDEPLGALDAFTRMSVQDSLLELTHSTHTTTILVTHDIDEALYLADRIVIFSPRPGRIHEEFVVDEGHPRLRNSPAFLERRKHILEILHFAPSEADLFATGGMNWQI